MKQMHSSKITQKRFLGLLALVMASTVATGVIYGNYSHRWGSSASLLQAADHLNQFPVEIGDWKILEEDTMSDAVQQVLQCAGYVNRRYINTSTGESVGVALIVGPPGPTAVHTPEICYSSRAYTLVGAVERNQLTSTGGEISEFWSTRFKSRNVGAEQQQVYHAWSEGGPWLASDHPRIDFGGNKLLYKIQVAGLVQAIPGLEDQDPTRSFLQALIDSDWTLSQVED